MCFNNSALVNSIVGGTRFKSRYLIFEESYDGIKYIAEVKFKSNQNSICFNRFDLAVMDAIYSLQNKKNDIITPQMISSMMTCKRVYHKDPTKVMKSIEKLSSMNVSIDCFYIDGFGETCIDPDLSISGPLIEFDSHATNTKITHKETVAYKIRSMPLYDYAECVGRILTIPTKFLHFSGGAIENDIFLLLKHEIAKSIQAIRSSDPETTRINLMFDEDSDSNLVGKSGLNRDGYANNRQWNKRQCKNRKQIEIILNCMKETGYIEDVQMIRSNTCAIGAQIYFPHHKALSRMKQAEEIIDDAYPYNTFVGKTKKAIKTVFLCTKALMGKFDEDD